MSGEFAEKAGESEDNQEDVVDDEGLLDQREEAPVPEYDLDRSAKAILDVPMEIASPIESEEEELLLDTSDEFGGKRGKVEREGVSGHGAKLTEKDSDDTRGQVQEPDDTVHTENGQKQGHSSHSLDRNESISSVQIDPSYQPDAEELLYEGDVETEARLAKVESARDEEGEGDTRDDCFVFDVTGDNMELDEHPSEKPKKDGGHKAEAAEASGQDSTAPSSTPAQSNATEGLSEQERFVSRIFNPFCPPGFIKAAFFVAEECHKVWTIWCVGWTTPLAALCDSRVPFPKLPLPPPNITGLYSTPCITWHPVH